MSRNYSKSLYSQYEDVLNELEQNKNLLKETNQLVKSLTKTIESLNGTIEQFKKENEEQAREILRLKNKNNKDSSNFSKTSGTNGFKKVITNHPIKAKVAKNDTNHILFNILFISIIISIVNCASTLSII